MFFARVFHAESVFAARPRISHHDHNLLNVLAWKNYSMARRVVSQVSSQPHIFMELETKRKESTVMCGQESLETPPRGASRAPNNLSLVRLMTIYIFNAPMKTEVPGFGLNKLLGLILFALCPIIFHSCTGF